MISPPCGRVGSGGGPDCLIYAARRRWAGTLSWRTRQRVPGTAVSVCMTPGTGPCWIDSLASQLKSKHKSGQAPPRRAKPADKKCECSRKASDTPLCPCNSMRCVNEPTGSPGNPVGLPTEPSGWITGPTVSLLESTGIIGHSTGTAVNPVGTVGEPVDIRRNPTGKSGQPVGKTGNPTGPMAGPVVKMTQPTGPAAQPVGSMPDWRELTQCERTNQFHRPKVFRKDVPIVQPFWFCPGCIRRHGIRRIFQSQPIAACVFLSPVLLNSRGLRRMRGRTAMLRRAETVNPAGIIRPL